MKCTRGGPKSYLHGLNKLFQDNMHACAQHTRGAKKITANVIHYLRYEVHLININILSHLCFFLLFLMKILSCQIFSYLKPSAIFGTATVTCIVYMEKDGEPRKFEEAKKRFLASPCVRSGPRLYEKEKR